MSASKKYMNVKQVAQFLEMLEIEVRSKMKTGRAGFPKHRTISPRTHLFETEEVEAYKKSIDILSGAKEIIQSLISDIPKHAAYEMFVCGVYVLQKEGRIVYIGQSVNVSARVRQHWDNGKSFDHVRVIPCEKSKLDDWEGFLIRLIEPEMNGLGCYQPKSKMWDTVLSASLTQRSNPA